MIESLQRKDKNFLVVNLIVCLDTTASMEAYGSPGDLLILQDPWTPTRCHFVVRPKLPLSRLRSC